MKTLVTGASGFVGKHLVKELIEAGHEVFGIGTRATVNTTLVNYIQLNLMDKEKVSYVLKDLKPDYVYHLAGVTNVKYSWENKAETLMVNTIGTLNLLDAIRDYSPNSNILTVGSSEEYGPRYDINVPLNEEEKLEPVTPYGISKSTISMLVRQYDKVYGLNVKHARPFNHIGPGQSKGFVVSDFAAQINEIEKGKANREIKVGNLSAIRDFTDVRDIIKAYKLIIDKGETGQIYNVCSGTGVQIEGILKLLIKLSNVNISFEVDPTLYRPTDIPFYVGDNRKLQGQTGWEPIIKLEDTLNDVLMYLRTNN